MKKLLSILFIFFSSALFGQTSNDAKTDVFPKLIIGTWKQTHIDSAFGHKSELKFTFNEKKTFIIIYSLDNQVKEKYDGSYKIINSSIVELSIKGKPKQHYKIIQISLGLLKLKEKASSEILNFSRE